MHSDNAPSKLQFAVSIDSNRIGWTDSEVEMLLPDGNGYHGKLPRGLSVKSIHSLRLVAHLYSFRFSVDFPLQKDYTQRLVPFISLQSYLWIA